MAFDAFLKFDVIDGESTDAKHKGEIEILSYSFGLSNSGSAIADPGTGEGKVSFQDFHFVSRLQKSSPVLFLKCASGEHIKEAVLSVRKAGGTGLAVDYYKVKLTDIVVSSFQQGGTGDGQEAVPLEQISLNFAKFQMQYQTQNAKGALTGSPVVAGWDLKENVKI